MRRGLVIVVLMYMCSSIFAQHDPIAKEILDAVSEKTRAYKTVKASFSYTMKDIDADIEETFQGTAIFEGSKYKLLLNNNEIISDGITKWVYLSDAEEVQISNIADQIADDENVLNDPTKILNIYEEGFKYKYIGKSTFDDIEVEEIDLVPEDIEKPYFKIKVFVKKSEKELKALKYFSKDGARYIINIKSLEIDNEYAENFFMFDKTKYPDVYEVDLRE